MPHSDDPVLDFARYDAEQMREIEKLPICEYCNQHIQDDFAFLINDEIICERCLIDNFRKDIDYLC